MSESQKAWHQVSLEVEIARLERILRNPHATTEETCVARLQRENYYDLLKQEVGEGM